MKIWHVSAAFAAVTLLGAGCSASTEPAAAPQAAIPTQVQVAQPAPAAAPAPAPAPAFAIGDKVLADWKGGDRWYDATVSGVGSGGANYFLVTYTSDKSTEVLGSAKLAHAPTVAAAVNVGDKVVAKWTNGQWYGGTVAAVVGSSAKITWSDKSQTTVAATDIAIAGK
ncbi:DUF4537 domain-containing protein [Candidatus Berkelbacteria bacterium]|nr:DUF4537 domain-containing protein [Candidatus Berkelbacteria bacterium]